MTSNRRKRRVSLDLLRSGYEGACVIIVPLLVIYLCLCVVLC